MTISVVHSSIGNPLSVADAAMERRRSMACRGDEKMRLCKPGFSHASFQETPTVTSAGNPSHFFQNPIVRSNRFIASPPEQSAVLHKAFNEDATEAWHERTLATKARPTRLRFSRDLMVAVLISSTNSCADSSTLSHQILSEESALLDSCDFTFSTQ